MGTFLIVIPDELPHLILHVFIVPEIHPVILDLQ